MLNQRNITSRLINQAQMRKKFPKGFAKTNSIISRLLSHNKITPQITKQSACRQFETIHFDLIWLMSVGIFHFSDSASPTYAINVSTVPGLSTSAAEPVLFAGACRERRLFPDTMIASLAASPIIVVLQQNCVLRFLIKIRTAQ